ncbi:MAG: hypothetical protein ABSH48_06965 [Verrucomicrobiota bacterium]|jgi:hypothetical protein
MIRQFASVGVEISVACAANNGQWLDRPGSRGRAARAPVAAGLGGALTLGGSASDNLSGVVSVWWTNTLGFVFHSPGFRVICVEIYL